MTAPDSNPIQVVPIPALNDNYIWCIHDTVTRRAVVVDPGDAAPVFAFLERADCELVGILVTHHHADHTHGVARLAAHYHCPVYASASEHSLFRDFDQPCREGDRISLFGIDLRVLEVPGHTLDHIAYFSEGCAAHPQPWLFCGDTMFSAGCGRIFNGTAALLHQAITRLNTLPDNTLIFCTHEYTLANLQFAAHCLPMNDEVLRYTRHCKELRHQNLPTLPTTLQQERLINPFLRLKDAELLMHLEMDAATDDCTIFTQLRAERDQFNAVLNMQKNLLNQNQPL